jgi:hypothetical protein
MKKISSSRVKSKSYQITRGRFGILVDENCCDPEFDFFYLPNPIQLIIMEMMVRISFDGYICPSDKQWSSFKSFSLVCKKWREFSMSLFKNIKKVYILGYQYMGHYEKIDSLYFNNEPYLYFWTTGGPNLGELKLDSKKKHVPSLMGSEPPLPRKCSTLYIFLGSHKEWNLRNLMKFFQSTLMMVIDPRFPLSNDFLKEDLNMCAQNLGVFGLSDESRLREFKKLLTSHRIVFPKVEDFGTILDNRSLVERSPSFCSDYSFLPRINNLDINEIDHFQSIIPHVNMHIPKKLTTGIFLKKLDIRYICFFPSKISGCNALSGILLVNQLPIINDVLIFHMDDSLRSLLILFWVFPNLKKLEIRNLEVNLDIGNQPKVSDILEMINRSGHGGVKVPQCLERLTFLTNDLKLSQIKKLLEDSGVTLPDSCKLQVENYCPKCE